MNYKEIALGEIADITKLAGFEFTKHIEYVENGEIIALRGLNVKNGELDLNDVKKIHRDVSNSLLRSKLFLNDILLTYTGTIGQVALIEENDKFHLAPNVAKVTIKENYNPYFYYTYFRSEIFQEKLRRYSVGSTQATIPMKTIREIYVPNLPLEIQNIISNKIKLFDTKIKVNKKIIRILEDSLNSLFKLWFINFEFPNEQGLPYRSSGGEMVESELEEIPVHWDIGNLEAYFYLHYGKSLTKKDRVEGEVPVYGSGGVTGSHNKALVKGPGIIVGRKGSIGTLYYEMKDFYPIDTVFYIESKKYSLNFIFNLLQTYDFTKSNNDSAVPGLNRNLVYNTKVIIPPEKIIKEFEKIVEPINRKIFLLKEEIENLKNLRNTLLPKLLSGEIEIPDESVVERS